ncbi:MAG: NAD(+)/NADH kinase [Dehalococcoidia bacterium]|nr:NAD(+)/NADH kinase [Dehalococcoidia bacterium]
MKRLGILYHPKVQKSEQFALKLEGYLKRKGVDCWLHSSWDEQGARSLLDKSDFIISVGGDGTILRTARIIFPLELPIIGINFGNLGFMAELEAEDAFLGLTSILKGQGWIDERAMLQVTVKSSGKTYSALNDVVAGRGKNMRLVNVEVRINDEQFTTYRSDAVIAATATGSTGYSLAANGPILYPKSREIILKAVCPHLNMDKALILSPDCRINLKVFTNHDAILSMDGQIECALANEDEIEVTLNHHVSKFLRLRPSGTFYTSLVSKLKGKSL